MSKAYVALPNSKPPGLFQTQWPSLMQCKWSDPHERKNHSHKSVITNQKSGPKGFFWQRPRHTTGSEIKTSYRFFSGVCQGKNMYKVSKVLDKRVIWSPPPYSSNNNHLKLVWSFSNLQTKQLLSHLTSNHFTQHQE